MNPLDVTEKHPSEACEDEEYVFAVVILHYSSIDLTRKCIASLRNLDAGAAIMKIVIVDNASPNGSGEELRKIYASDEDIHVLINEENFGFSIANNKGFEYAVATWNPDAVLVLNNDTQIVQEDFIAVLQKKLQQNGVYVVSPDIFAPRIDTHQSPIRANVLKPQEIRERIAYYQRVLNGAEARSLKGRIKALPIVRVLLALREKRYRAKRNETAKRPQWNVVPSGAALIFSKRFIETGELPFVPPTFLYYEEDILMLRCRRNGWNLLYSPELQVLHFHEGTTSEVVPTSEAKRLFIAKHYLDSLRVLLGCYEGENGRKA